MQDFFFGPYVKFVLAFSLIGIVLRTIFFARTLGGGNSRDRENEWYYVFGILGRWLFPLHRAFNQRPVYCALRYLFHLCLFIAPLGGSAHLSLLEESSLGWAWSPLPDEWLRPMVLVVLCCLAWFLARKVISPNLRKAAAPVEYFLIVLTALPFLTGFLAAEGWGDYALVITAHLLSGGVLLIAITMLFCKSTVDSEKCKSCSACVMTCPTGALAANDQAYTRTFEYSHYQCICCANCMVSCPEDAVDLRHRIGVKLFWERKRTIDRRAKIALCVQCDAPFIPVAQLEQVEQLIAERGLENGSVYFCERCKRRNFLCVT